jgi:ketosteroid isomerase-like protein
VTSPPAKDAQAAGEAQTAADAETAGEVQTAARVVMEFLACGGRRDFSGARALLDADVTRTGPDGDVKSGRDNYVAYLESVLGDVRDYRYEVRRTAVSTDGLGVVVEIDEALTQADGTKLAVSEAMAFDITAEGRIRRISVYTKI